MGPARSLARRGPQPLPLIDCFNASYLTEIAMTTPTSDMEFEGKGTRVTIRGRGFGHGVGMCQYCTKSFAERGRA